MKQKFLVCNKCGNIVAVVKESGVPVMCCGQKMEQIIPGTVEASVEKHVPVYTVNGNLVEVVVGSVEHPMQDVHYIEMIILETKKGLQVKYLNPGEEPYAEFLLDNDEVVAAYEYCNLHGLWKYEV